MKLNTTNICDTKLKQLEFKSLGIGKAEMINCIYLICAGNCIVFMQRKDNGITTNVKVTIIAISRIGKEVKILYKDREREGKRA